MELIDRDAAIALIEQRQKELCPVGRFGRNAVYDTDRDIFDAWDEIIDQITALPTIDAAPVVHGKWKTIRCSGAYTGGGNPVWGCTKCGYMYGASILPPKFAFCPSCGARIDGGEAGE